MELLDQLRHKEVDLGGRAQILGTLAGLITIPDAYQEAIEAALSARLATMVVGDRQELWSVVDALDGQPAAIAAPWLISSPHLPRRPAITRALSAGRTSLVETRTRDLHAVQLLLGRVLLVQDRQAAYELAPTLPTGALAAGLDGFIVHPGGLLEAPGQSAAESILGRETAWREANENLDALRAGLSALEQPTRRANKPFRTNQDQVDEWQNEERRLSKEETEHIQRLSAAQRQLDRARQQQAFIEPRARTA